MARLNSYHMKLTLSPEGTDITIPIDYERGKYDEKITDPTSGEITELSTAGGLFTRNCSDADHCNQWVLQPPNGPSPSTITAATPNRYAAPTLGGLTTVFPETLAFTAVDIAMGWQTKEGSPATLDGQVDLERAIDENRSRVGIPTDTPGYTNEPSTTALPLSTIEVQVDGSGSYYQTVQIYVPGDPNNPYLVVDFSRFNEVSVTTPGDYTVGPSY